MGSGCGHEMKLVPGHRMRLKTDGFPKRGQSDWLTNAQLEYFVLAFRESELLPLNSQKHPAPAPSEWLPYHHRREVLPERGQAEELRPNPEEAETKSIRQCVSAWTRPH